MRLIEGNHNPGNPFTGDNLPPPMFCPVCGRTPLDYFYWLTVDNDLIYPSFVCYGRGWERFRGRIARVVWKGWPAPMGAHYQYKLPSGKYVMPSNYDRETGSRLSRQ